MDASAPLGGTGARGHHRDALRDRRNGLWHWRRAARGV